MITKRQAELLRNSERHDNYVRHGSADHKELVALSEKHPHAISWYYCGLPITSGDHTGCCAYSLDGMANELLSIYDASATVGFEGRAREVDSGLEFDFHFRAASLSALRSALRRSRGYHKCEIITAEPLTHDEWVKRYGWGRM